MFKFFLTLAFVAAAQAGTPIGGQDSCLTNLVRHSPLTESGLQAVLRHPDTTPREAIAEIYYFLRAADGDGQQKYAQWNDLVHLFNSVPEHLWLASPCLRTGSGDYACWGSVRGHLIVFRRDGQVFKDYNPREPNPQELPGYEIPWHRFAPRPKEIRVPADF